MKAFAFVVSCSTNGWLRFASGHAVCSCECCNGSATCDCAGLERLHLISLSKITNEGILPLRRLGKLKHIMLARCPNVCETGLHVSYNNPDACTVHAVHVCSALALRPIRHCGQLCSPAWQMYSCRPCSQCCRCVEGFAYPDAADVVCLLCAGAVSRETPEGVHVRNATAPEHVRMDVLSACRPRHACLLSAGHLLLLARDADQDTA